MTDLIYLFWINISTLLLLISFIDGGGSSSAPAVPMGGGSLQEEMARKLAARMNKSNGNASAGTGAYNNSQSKPQQSTSKCSYFC